jgi:hypothetical protein
MLLPSEPQAAAEKLLRKALRSGGNMLRIIAQNKTLFAAVAGLTLFFGVVLLAGVKRIYDRESEWRYNQAGSQLLAGRAAIQSFLASFEHHLNFLANLTLKYLPLFS